MYVVLDVQLPLRKLCFFFNLIQACADRLCDGACLLPLARQYSFFSGKF